MQTACWQLWFSDRFTGARNPARLPTTIQSRRIRCAPTSKRGWWQVLRPHILFYHSRAYNRSMRNRDLSSRALRLPPLLLCAVAAWRPRRMTKLNIVVKTQSGKPVDRASVVVRFVEGHSVVKLGKAIRTTFEMRTNQEGEVNIPSIPQGKIRIQVIAKGYQTFGQIFDVTEDEKTVDITLNPPQQQYSAHQ